MDFKNFMQQAMKMQKQMEKQQAELAAKEFNANAGSGAVSVSVNGNYEITNLAIDNDLLSLDNKDILVDYLTLALNEALRNVTQEKEAGMESLGISFDINSLLR